MDTPPNIAGIRPTSSFVWAKVVAAHALIFGYYYSFLDYGLNIWDEGGFANGTLRTFQGQMAVRDFNPIGYLPGRYLYASWFFDWFGVNLHSLRLSVAVLTPFMVIMVYAIARRLMPQGFALIAGTMMLSAPGMYYNRFFPFFCVLNLFLLVRWLELPNAKRGLTLAGAILLCVAFKMEVSIFTTALWCILSPWRNREGVENSPNPSHYSSRMKRFWIGGLAGVALLLAFVYLWRYGILDKFITIVFTTHAVWGNPFPALFPLKELWQELGPDVLFERVMFFLPLAAYASVLILLGWNKIRSTTALETKDVCLLAVTGVGVCAYGLVVWRAGFDNLIRTLPAFYIVTPYLLFRLHRRVMGYVCKATQPPKVFSAESVLIHFLVAVFPLLFLYEMNVKHGFYAGSIGAVRKNTQYLGIDRLQVWTNPHEAGWITGIMKKLETSTRPGEAILALPLNPLFYFMSNRRNPIVHDWILPGMLEEPAQAAVVKHLITDPPKIVVLANIPIDGMEDRRFSHFAGTIHQHLISNFELWEKIGLFEILIPKNPSILPEFQTNTEKK